MTRSGLILVDKPAGPTSHDVVDRVRRLLGLRRVGHAGTLDPFATGLLPVCFGTWTRLTAHLAGHTKRYTARVRFGFATDTDDASGQPIGQRADQVAVDIDTVQKACGALIGEIDQVAPAYSAKRVNGRRLHETARKGQTVTAPTTRVRIDDLRVVEAGGGEAVIDVTCSAGTYVRAIARDLGSALGWGGHLVELRRTEAAGFRADEAQSLEGLASGAEAPMPIAAERVLADWPLFTLTDAEWDDVSHGRVFRRPDAQAALRARLFFRGNLVALADVLTDAGSQGCSVRPRVVLSLDD